MIEGIRKDEPIVVNDVGGKQSKLDYRFDLIDPITMFALAKVCSYGADKYGAWNWRRIDVDTHINHALAHIYAYLSRDTQDDHLEHAFCRLMFALSLILTPGVSERMNPNKVIMDE
jgi:hypothetical protein